jgi:hypothetical protein
MNQQLRDALLEDEHLRKALRDELMYRMAQHMDRGLEDEEALIVSVEEIKRIIRGSRLGLVRMLIDNAMRDALYAREHGMHMH